MQYKMEENNDQSKRTLQKLIRHGYKLIHKEPEKAHKFFLKAYKGARDLEIDKIERTCAFNLGALLIELGQPKEGVEYLYKAIPPESEKDDKSNGDIYYNLGIGYEKMANPATGTEREMEQKKAIHNYRKAVGEYESERNSEKQIECLEKILSLLKEPPGNIDEILRAYDDLVQLLDKEEQLDRKLSILCEKANVLRKKEQIKEAEQDADECLNIAKNIGQSASETTARSLNELGLLYTQIQQYEKATQCFEQALPIIRSCQGDHKLEAVILQNLGAAYNFVGDYQRSKTFHLQAADKFGKLHNRHSQGQCYANLAFAHSQLGDNDGAWEYFILARQAAQESGDANTIWQVHEGLGSVQFNRGNLEKAEEYFKNALKELGNRNEDAFNRIVSKLKHVHESQTQAFPGKRRLAGSPFGTRSFGPQHMRGIQNQSRTGPDGPQPEDNGVRETFVQPASEPPPVMHENHFYTEPGHRVVPVERDDSNLPIHHQRVNRGFSFHTGEMQRARIMAEEEENSTNNSDSDDTSGDTDSDTTDTGSDNGNNERKEVSPRQFSSKSMPRNQALRWSTSAILQEDAMARPRQLPVHAAEGTMGSMRHRYEALLERKEEEEQGAEEESRHQKSAYGNEYEQHHTPRGERLPVRAAEGMSGSQRRNLPEQKEGDVEDETEETGSDTESDSDEETETERQHDYSRREQPPSVPPESPPAGSLVVNTYENVQPHKQAKRHATGSDSDEIGQGSPTGSGTYAEVDFSTKTYPKHAGNGNAEEFQERPKRSNMFKVNYLPTSDEDDGQSSEQDEAGNVSPRQGTSAGRSHRKSDSSDENEKHTPRGESEKRLYQEHRKLREKQNKENKLQEEGKPSKTCTIM